MLEGKKTNKQKKKTEKRETDLITDMQGEEQDQHASGGVAPMMSGPVVMDVFKESWVEDLDLRGGRR